MNLDDLISSSSPTLKVVITGGPRTGKTTLADRFKENGVAPFRIMHTDDVMNLAWSDASAEVASWFSTPGPWIIEGVASVRALRKFMRVRDGAPCDVVVWTRRPKVDVSPWQRAMGRGHDTIMNQVVGDLVARNVSVRAEADPHW